MEVRDEPSKFLNLRELGDNEFPPIEVSRSLMQTARKPVQIVASLVERECDIVDPSSGRDIAGSSGLLALIQLAPPWVARWFAVVPCRRSAPPR